MGATESLISNRNPNLNPAPTFHPKIGTDNFPRLCQLIMTICSDLFRNILSRYIKPADLRVELDKNKTRLERIVNDRQRKQIYPSSDSATLTSKDLDIYVLYILLRTICNIPEHRTGWGNPPLDADISLAACIERIRIRIERIRIQRNLISAQDTVFKDNWDELKNSILKIEKQLTGGDMYERGVDELLLCDLNPTRTMKYVKEFKTIEDGAMSDIPGQPTTPYFNPTKATENFPRLCQLIMTICSDLFRDILSHYIKPADLRSELDKNRTELERIMNRQQKKHVYPSSGTTTLTSKDLDISVLYILLRSICNISEHRNGWGNYPLDTDTSLAACIERINIRRRLIFPHSTKGEIENTSFQDHWDELKNSILEIEKQLIGSDMYERGVDELLSRDLDPTRTMKYVNEFKKVEEHTMDTQGILRKFQHWLHMKYKNIKIVEMYVGIQKKSLKRVLVLVIDDHDFLAEHTFEDDGEVFQIVCKLWKFPPSEGAYVSRLDRDRKIPETKLIELEGCLKDVSKRLLENHSNLEIVSVSAHRSRKNGEEVEFEPCIVLYCSCKGIIPYNELEFPTQINGVKTDVREGFFYLFPNDNFFKRAADTLDPLLIGANIGKRDQLTEGTLGGFVNFNNGEMGFITCAHVLFDMSTTNASQTNTSQTSFDVVQPSYAYTCTNEVCGVHERSVFPTNPTNPRQGITVDAALIRLTSRAPQRGLFSELRAGDLLGVGFSLQRLPEYGTGATRDYSNGMEQVQRWNPCIKCGARSGLTSGSISLNGLAARYRHCDINFTNPPSQSVYPYLKQLEIHGISKRSFALEGDSGSLVFQVDSPGDLKEDDKLFCIGMVVGGTSPGSTVVTPINAILEALNARMCAFPQERME